MGKGKSHPPKNSMVHKLDISNILEYSPKKNSAKVIEEYSVLYPDTSSASASGRSKGARFVSANIDIKKITHNGDKGMQYQVVIYTWLTTIEVKFRLPEHKQTPSKEKPMVTSYEIICAADRIAPMKEYRELLDQPASTIP